eukprot:Gb_15040 [translate_table: standard]
MLEIVNEGRSSGCVVMPRINKNHGNLKSQGQVSCGNKFGEPLIQGYTKTFGMRLTNGELREWLKPIMFSAGSGQISHRHIMKGKLDVGILVVKVEAPTYRITTMIFLCREEFLPLLPW